MKKRGINKRHTLRNSILRIFTVSMLVLLGMEIIIYCGCRYIYNEQLRSELKLTVENTSKNIDNYFDDVNNLSYTIFYNNIFVGMINSKDSSALEFEEKSQQISNYFAGFTASSELILGIDFYDLNGRSYFTRNDENMRLRTEEVNYLSEMAHDSNGKIIYSDMSSMNSKGKYSGIAFREVRGISATSASGQKIGLGIIHLNINKLIDRLIPEMDKELFSVFVTDKEQMCIYETNGKIKGIQKLLESDITEEPKNIRIDSKNCDVYKKHITNLNWDVYIVRDKKDVDKAINTIFVILAVFFGINVIIMIYLLQKINHEFTGPILKILEGMKNAASSRMKNRIELKCRNEISDIGDTFNEMNAEIRKLTKKIMNTQKQFYELEIEKNKFELVGLQTQINSHFLFNTLYYIKTEVRIGDAKKAGNAIDNLCSFLRYAVEAKQYVKLYEELENIRYYVEIVFDRTGGSIKYSVEYDNNLKNCKMLRLVIQPLVENSIVHGYIDGRCTSFSLKIVCTSMDNEKVQIKVMDTGQGIDKDKLKKLNQELSENTIADIEEMSDRDKSHGIGLKNINRRLKIYYGEEYGLSIKSFEGIGTIIKVVIPKRDMDSN